MGNRYGRNQRRRHRVRIARLEESLSRTELMRKAAAQQLIREKHVAQAAVHAHERLREWLRSFGVVSPPVVDPESIEGLRYGVDKPHRMSIATSVGPPTGPADAPNFGEVEVFSLVAEVRLRDERAGDQVHFNLRYGTGDESAYMISREALRNAGAVDQVVARISRKLVDHLVAQGLDR